MAEPIGLQGITTKLKGWKTIFDATDYCPGCWPVFLATHHPEQKDAFEEHSIPTANLFVLIRRDGRQNGQQGFFVCCTACKIAVFVPYSPNETCFS